MSGSLTAEVPAKIESLEPNDVEAKIKKDEDDNDHERYDEEDAGGGGGTKPSEHTTINVTNRPEGNNKDDCSDITDNQETEEQSSRTFPQKLMDVLTNEEHNGIISFLEHGNGFMIHKKRVFAAEVLPKYFKASKFTSFTRKLNRWGFQRISRGPETGAYYHKLFRRDKPEFVLQMSSNSGSKYRAPTYPAPLLPNLQAGGLVPGAAAAMPQGIFPFSAPSMMGGAPMPNLFPGAATGALTFQQQQQQILWQQQMQFMQFQMMQMQQQQTAMQAAMIQQQQLSQTQAPQQPAAAAYGMPNSGPPTGSTMVPSLPNSMAGAATSNSAPLDGMTNQAQEYHDALQQPGPQGAELSPLGAQIRRLDSDDGGSASDIGATNVDAV